MKVLFLDIDGVLNTVYSLRQLRISGQEDIDDFHLTHLAKIVKTAQCKIVLSTSWRHNKELIEAIKRRLSTVGIADEIIGKTPDYVDEPRAAEIEDWLSSHPEVTKFAVVDDDDDAGLIDNSANFFQTDSHYGLTGEIADRIIAHLGKD